MTIAAKRLPPNPDVPRNPEKVPQSNWFFDRLVSWLTRSHTIKQAISDAVHREVLNSMDVLTGRSVQAAGSIIAQTVTREHNVTDIRERLVSYYFDDAKTIEWIRQSIEAETEQYIHDKVGTYFSSENARVTAQAILEKILLANVQRLESASDRASNDIKHHLETILRSISSRAAKKDMLQVMQQALTSRRITSPNPSIERDLSYYIKAAKCGNILFVGPAGCGKTETALQIAEQLNAQLYFSGPVHSEYKLLGFVDAKSAYVRTAFRAAYEDGGVFIFEELDASDPNALLSFTTALGNRYCAFPDRDDPVSMHAGFICIATANTPGTGATSAYNARNQLDKAFIDRFMIFEFDYDHDLEMKLALKEWREDGLASKDAISSWVRQVQAIRKKAQPTDHVVSMRASIVGARLLVEGIPRAVALSAAVRKALPKELWEKIYVKEE